MLISSALNFETIFFKKENDLPYVLYLPSYTAAAYYHKKLSRDLQGDLQKTLKEVRNYANLKGVVKKVENRYLGFFRQLNGRRHSFQSGRFLNLSAFPTTDTELKLIAAAAIIGLRSSPKNG